jgi:hypothetical protein
MGNSQSTASKTLKTIEQLKDLLNLIPQEVKIKNRFEIANCIKNSGLDESIAYNIFLEYYGTSSSVEHSKDNVNVPKVKIHSIPDLSRFKGSDLTNFETIEKIDLLNLWTQTYRRTRDNNVTIGPLYYYVKKSNVKQHMTFIRKWCKYDIKEPYYWNDLVNELSLIQFPQYEYCNKDGSKRDVTITEIKGEIEEWLITRIAKCIRFITDITLLVVLKLDKYDVCRVGKLSQLAGSYTHVSVPVVTTNDSDYKITYIPLFTWAKRRIELGYAGLKNIPYHHDQGDFSVNEYGIDAFNTFQGFAGTLKDVPDDLSDIQLDILSYLENPNNGYHKIYPIIRHIHDVFASGNREWFEYILEWLAWPIVNPGKKTGVALVLIGGQGCGKSAFMTYFAKYVYGLKLSGVALLDQITSRFKVVIKDKLFVIVEVPPGKTPSKYTNKLKRRITDELHSMGCKHSDGFSASYVLISNELHCLNISEDDRQFAVFKCSNQYVNDTEYHKNLAECFNQETGDLMYTFFRKRYAISKFTHLGGSSIPKTETKESIVQLSKPNQELALNAIISSDFILPHEIIKYIDNKIFISSNGLYEAYKDWMKEFAPYTAVGTRDLFIEILKGRSDIFDKTEKGYRTRINGPAARGLYIIPAQWDNIMVDMSYYVDDNGKHCRSELYPEDAIITLSNYVSVRQTTLKTTH